MKTIFLKPALYIFAVCFLFSCSREKKAENRVAARFHTEELPDDFKVDLSQRKVFSFSVVPGGTVTRDEVRSNVASDHVVREHYKGIQIDQLKPFRLTKPAQAYVSYRIGDRIFWTARRLYLKPGELLLSDGSNLIRGRCGNRISLEATGPVQAFGEPSEAVLDLPSWGAPVLKAMAEEENWRDSDKPLFELKANGPMPLQLQSGKLPESIFSIVPPVISGGLPGALPPFGGGGEFNIIGSPLIFVASPPLAVSPPGILLPSIKPIESARIDLPPGITSDYPSGVGGSVVYLGALQPLSGFMPPIHVAPGILLSGGTPPFLFVPPGVITSPDESPLTVRLQVPVLPPDAELPPAFQPVPEPSTSGMVALAAALMYLIKLRPWQRLEQCRSSGGRPLR